MLKETIKYTDFNGVERTEDFYFNLTETELLNKQTGTEGGFDEKIKRIVASNSVPEIFALLNEIIIMSYGEKSLDGKSFKKKDATGRPLGETFIETAAYDAMYMKFMADPETEIARFINGIIPANLAAKVAEQQKNGTLPFPTK